MKLAIRVFGIVIALAGFAAASVPSSPSHQNFRSHQSVADAMPVPLCGPVVCTPPTNGK